MVLYLEHTNRQIDQRVKAIHIKKKHVVGRKDGITFPRERDSEFLLTVEEEAEALPPFPC